MSWYHWMCLPYWKRNWNLLFLSLIKEVENAKKEDSNQKKWPVMYSHWKMSFKAHIDEERAQKQLEKRKTGLSMWERKRLPNVNYSRVRWRPSNILGKGSLFKNRIPKYRTRICTQQRLYKITDEEILCWARKWNICTPHVQITAICGRDRGLW